MVFQGLQADRESAVEYEYARFSFPANGILMRHILAHY